MEFLCVGMKGMHQRKAQWIDTRRMRELYPHLFSKWFHAFCGPKDFKRDGLIKEDIKILTTRMKVLKRLIKYYSCKDIFKRFLTTFISREMTSICKSYWVLKSQKKKGGRLEAIKKGKENSSSSK